MQVTKKYKAGGFFGNSQAKFGHMAGAEGGFNRKEFRELRRKKRRGESLSGTEGQRLNFMKNVRKDRFKKGLAGAALAGTAAAVAGPAALTALKASKAAKLAKAGADVTKAVSGASKAKGLSGLASKAGSLLKSDGAKKALDIAKKIQGSNLPASFGKTQAQGMQSLGATPFQMPQAGGLMAPGAGVGQGVLPIQEFDMPEENFDYESEAVDQGVQDFDQGEENFDDGSGFDLMGALQQFGNFYTGDKGMKVVKNKTSGDLLKALEAYEGRKKRESVPSITGRSMDDKEMLMKLIEKFAQKRRGTQSRPASIMG
tara:strand:+ start:60 stop:1001 length:942 start_codon:yes stop_codon:yes gene_type:complete